MKRALILALTVLMVISTVWFLAGCNNPTGGGGGGGTVIDNGLPLVFVSTTGSDETGTGTSELPYKTIQKGLSRVASGGLVSVESGIYTENITWCANANVILRGASAETTIIDGNHSGMCIDVNNINDCKVATIENFTIINGYTSSGYTGAGISLHGNAMTLYLNKVIIINCSSESHVYSYQGGGVAIFGWPCMLEANQCQIINNTSDTGGGVGGILNFGILKLYNCNVSGNAGGFVGGIFCFYNGKIENCIVSNNSSIYGNKGGLYLYDYAGMSIDVINSTIVSNESPGVYSYYSLSRLVNCIIWGNNVDFARDNYGDPVGNLTVKYCNVQGGFSGPGNINIDPSFQSSIDYHLTSSTPISVSRGATVEGIPSRDYDGNPRTFPYSMGAYEYD